MPSHSRSKSGSSCVSLVLGVSALCALAAYNDIEVIDGVTAATKAGPGTVVTLPKFSTKVITGPALASGARLLEGQRLQMNIGITNPWKNNTVTMEVSPKLAGLTLTPTGSNANPAWLLDWTPSGISSVTSKVLTFNATYKSSAGTQIYSANLTLPLGPHQPPVLTSLPVQVAGVAQPFTLNIVASSPENNAISFTLNPMPSGATLSKAEQQKDGSWLSTLKWTPSQASLGSNNLNITATDSYLNSSNGSLSSSSSTQMLNIQVFTPPAMSNTAIKNVTIGSAAWAAASSTLTVKGTIALNTGKKLPSASTVQIGTGSQVALSSAGTEVTPSSSGSFSATIKLLNATQVPCMVTAQLLINKVANNLPGFIAVTGAPPASCIN